MSKRSDELAAQLKQMRQRFAERVANALAAPTIILHSTPSDDSAFIDIDSRLITATAAAHELPVIYAVHIDNWFGARWLGFRGKLLGIAGVKSKTLKRSLIVPPFHPNRVLSARGHRLRDDGLYADAEDVTSLHPHITSGANLSRNIRGNIVHAWYSGNTISSRKGVVMIYHCQGDDCGAFYTMFDGNREWQLEEHVGITRQEVAALLETDACGSLG